MPSRDKKGIENMNIVIQKLHHYTKHAGTGYQASADSSADLKEEKDIDASVVVEIEEACFLSI